MSVSGLSAIQNPLAQLGAGASGLGLGGQNIYDMSSQFGANSFSNYFSIQPFLQQLQNPLMSTPMKNLTPQQQAQARQLMLSGQAGLGASSLPPGSGALTPTTAGTPKEARQAKKAEKKAKKVAAKEQKSLKKSGLPAPGAGLLNSPATPAAANLTASPQGRVFQALMSQAATVIVTRGDLMQALNQPVTGNAKEKLTLSHDELAMLVNNAFPGSAMGAGQADPFAGLGSLASMAQLGGTGLGTSLFGNTSTGNPLSKITGLGIPTPASTAGANIRLGGDNSPLTAA